jgi:hypothetical protein
MESLVLLGKTHQSHQLVENIDYVGALTSNTAANLMTTAWTLESLR